MKNKTLNKLSPEAREKIIEIEGKLREINEEKQIIDLRLSMLKDDTN